VIRRSSGKYFERGLPTPGKSVKRMDRNAGQLSRWNRPDHSHLKLKVQREIEEKPISHASLYTAEIQERGIELNMMIFVASCSGK
jgi:hypothetical protein